MFFCGAVTNANKIIPLSRQTSVEAEMKNANKAPVSETFVMKLEDFATFRIRIP